VCEQGPECVRFKEAHQNSHSAGAGAKAE